MMYHYRLRKPNMTPPGGWRYFDQDLNRWFSGDTLTQVQDAVVRARSVNHLSVPKDFLALIEHQVCTRVPASLRIRREGVSPALRAYHKTSASAILETSVFIRSGPLAPQSAVDSHAVTCLSCPHNGPEFRCYPCYLKGVFSGILGKEHRSSYDTKLGICQIDGTILKAAVHILPPAENPNNTRFPDGCWKRKPSPDPLLPQRPC